MPDAQAILHHTDWGSLQHAYGEASAAAEALAGLLSQDPAVCGNSLGFLDTAALHQGSIYSMTAPAALFVAGILGDPRVSILCESTLPWDERRRPLRAALLEWLGKVARSASYWDNPEHNEAAGDRDAADVCRAIRRDLYVAIVPFLDDPDDRIRKAASGAMAHLMTAPELSEFRGEQTGRIQRGARDGAALERAAAALTLGKWGVEPREFMTDPDPAVRAAAATAPALDTDPEALAEVRRALADPGAADAWFGDRLPQLEGRFRFLLVKTLLRRTSDFEEIVPEALAVARMTNAQAADFDWGPLLGRAFPRPYSSGRALTAAQRDFLAALAGNDECWEPVAGRSVHLRRAALPDDRAELAALLR